MSWPSGLVLSGGRVVTCDGLGETPEAVGILGTGIVALGSTYEVRRRLPAAHVVNVDGACVLPGLVDTHVHLVKTGLDAAKIHWDHARSLREALRCLGDAARTRPGNGWLEVFGEDNIWDEMTWPERRLPSRPELDGVAPDTPTVVWRLPQGFLLNTAAVKELDRLGLATRVVSHGLDPHPPVFPTGASEPGDRLITGRDAIAAVKSCIPPPTPGEVRTAAERACRLLNSYGTTSIIDAGRPGRFVEDYAAMDELALGSRLTLRVDAMLRPSPDWLIDEVISHLDDIGTLTGSADHAPAARPGSDRLRCGWAKLILDGEIDDALLRHDYPARPGYRGVQKVGEQDLDTLLHVVRGRGLRLGVHTMGGAATDVVLGAARRASVPPHLLCLLHVCQPSRANLALMEKSGVDASVQPTLLYCYGDEIVKSWGNEDPDGLLPLRSLLGRGIVTAGGTDTWPPNSFLGIRFAVERCSRSGLPIDPAQGLSPAQALGLYTTEAARLLGEHKRIGALRPGMEADLVVTEMDVLHTPAATLDRPGILATFVGGELVHGGRALGLA